MDSGNLALCRAFSRVCDIRIGKKGMIQDRRTMSFEGAFYATQHKPKAHSIIIGDILG